ncbi:UNVERIFIED_CONTAM: hypothetical protein NCL1_34393 [Trichonephila clavipes]
MNQPVWDVANQALGNFSRKFEKIANKFVYLCLENLWMIYYTVLDSLTQCVKEYFKRNLPYKALENPIAKLTLYCCPEPVLERLIVRLVFSYSLSMMYQ